MERHTLRPVETTPHMAESTVAAPVQRSIPWAAYVPFALFTIWMLVKQQLALQTIGISPGQPMLAASAGAILVLAPWAFRSRGRWQVLWVLLLDLLLTLLVYADILYFRQFGDLVSVASLRFAAQLSSVGGSVTALVKPEDLWFWADLPVIALVALLPTRVGSWVHGAGLQRKTAALVALGGMVIVGLIGYFDPMLSAKYFGHSNVASRLGLINYHAFDIGAYAARMTARLTPSDSAVAEVQSWFAPRRTPTTIPAGLAEATRGKNVIVLQVESLQAFPLGLSLNGQEVTPNLNRLAKESLNYTDFYTQTGQGVTSDADLLANCSLHPTRTGAVYYDYAANDFRCLPTLLRENGYSAVAMQGMPPDFWNLAAVYPRIGFERYFNIKDGFEEDETIGIGLSDESFLRQAVPKLKSLPEPYYAFLVTLTSHGPFEFPDLPITLNLGNLQGTEVGHYLNAVHYTDSAIGHFVDQLKAEGMLDQSILVLYGDHAGVFRNSTGMKDLPGIGPDDELNMTRLEKRVPFLVRLPGGAGAGERKLAAGQADIAPTIAALVNIPTDSTYFMGQNLLQAQDGTVAFYTGSAFSNEYFFWSRDNEPTIGKCYARPTGAEVDVNLCLPLANQSAQRLKISRLIVERNLIPKLRTPTEETKQP